MFTRSQLNQMVVSISNVQAQPTLINQALQIALDRVSEYFDYPYYIQDKGVINTTATYSTGTVSVANGSTAVTGVLTVWTSSMVGRKIRFANNNAYYRIATVGGVGSLTLEQPFQDTSIVAGTYIIYKDEFRLASDIKKYKTLRQAENAVTLVSLHPTRFDEQYPMPNSYADAIMEVMEGTLLDTYTTGTVTANTNTITGAGTAWTSVEGLGRLSLIRIGTAVYTIKSVDSDTQLTVYDSVAAVAVATAYEITLNNLRAQLYNIPNTARLYYYRYFRKPTPLFNDYDVPDMPHNYHHLLMWGALSEILSQKGDAAKAYEVYEARFIAGCEKMKVDAGSFTPDRIYRRKPLGFNRTRGLDAREKSSFDIRWSA